MSDNQIPQGQLGFAWGVGQALRDQTWHGYVQSFMGQGYTLAQAQAMANQAMGFSARKEANHFALIGGLTALWCLFDLISMIGAVATGNVNGGLVVLLVLFVVPLFFVIRWFRLSEYWRSQA